MLMIAEEQTAGATAPGYGLLDQAQAYIELHLDEPTLDQTLVARELSVSTRTLARAFQASGTSVATWIRHRRLDHCLEELVDGPQRDTPVAVVGARWGILDATHFSRIFRSRFGVTPSEARSASGGSPHLLPRPAELLGNAN
jgi:AraC-like DNA-binding protein